MVSEETRQKIKDIGLLSVLETAEKPLLDDKDIKRVEIIVLKYKSPDIENACIRNIITSTEWPYKLTIFDNRLNGPNTAKVWNKLIRESTCDYVLIIDSDAFVSNCFGKCWLTEMMRAFDVIPNVAIVAPVGGNSGVLGDQKIPAEDRDPFETRKQVSGYCFLVKKSVFEEEGNFDEDFCFYGQESDFEKRIFEHGKNKIVIVPRSLVVHGVDDKNNRSMSAKKADKDGEINFQEEKQYSRELFKLKEKSRKDGVMDSDFRDTLRDMGFGHVINRADAPIREDGDIKRVEIIILKYKSPEMEAECISDIINYTEWPYKITVFDNRGNGPNTAKAWNKLIKESTCDYIVMIDSDAFVRNTAHTCWLTEMMKSFDIYDNVAIAGPMCGTTATSTVQQDKPRNANPERIVAHLSGYCFLTKKTIYDKIGYFDEDFCLYGQESDWIERIMEANDGTDSNYVICIVPRAHVIHGKEGVGSISAIQANKSGEIHIGNETQYSAWLSAEKKRLRTVLKSNINHNG